MTAVSENLPLATEATSVRVPPAMIASCVRGGKTTILLHLFDELRDLGQTPVSISFNGDSIIRKLESETPLDTLLRAIACALMTQKPKRTSAADLVHCSKDSLPEQAQ